MKNESIDQIAEILNYIKRERDGNESELVEFKINNIDPSELGKNICAISNSCILNKSNEGFIVYGIEDETLNKVGVDFDIFNLKKGNQDLELWIRSNLTSADFEFIPVSDKKEKKNFLLIRIFPPIGRIATFAKEPYLRVGKNSNSLKNHKEKEVLLYKYFDPLIFWKRQVKKIEKNELRTYLDVDFYYTKTKQNIPNSTDDIIKDFEEELFLVKNMEGIFITNLGAILFAKNISSFPMLKNKTPRVITYKGKTKLDNSVKDVAGEMGYANGFEGLIKWIYSQIPETEVVGNVYRDKDIAYPDKAIRELVNNSLIHQDFDTTDLSGRPLIEIYEDRIEITNPGRSLISVNEIIQSISKTRNEILSEIMRRMYLCEKRGSGLDRAVQEIEKLILPAIKFENLEDGFRATMYRYKKFEDLTEIEKLNGCVQHVILMYYILKEPANNESLRKRFGVHSSQNYIISKLIKKALDLNLIKKLDLYSKSRKHIKYIPIGADS